MRPQSRSLGLRQEEHEIRGEAVEVALHLLVEPFGGDAVKPSEVSVDNDVLG